MPRVSPRPAAARRQRTPARLALAGLTAAAAGACGREFASEPAVAPRLEARAGWRDTLSVTDTAELEIRLVDAALGDLAPGRAAWTSSDDRVLRVEPLPAATGDAARDTLAARRTRVRVVAAGPGAVTLTVRTDSAAGLAGATRDFPVVVRPLRYVPVRWRAALSAGESDTLQVEVRDVRGRVLTDRTLRWRSSDETRLRLVPIPAAGAAADPAADRRLKVRAVALADGAVQVSVGLDPSVAAVGSDTALTVAVAPLAIQRSRGQDTLAVADGDTVQVRLGTTLTDSLPGRFSWESSNDVALRVTTPAPTGVAALDTLAARGARRVVTAVAPGTATLTVTSIPIGGEPAVQRRWTVTVLPLALQKVAWPDTVSVADAPRYAVRVVDARGRPALGATVVWRTSADTVLALPASAAGGRTATLADPGVWAATADARQFGDVTLTAVALGPTGAAAGALAAPVRVMERYAEVVATRLGACARSVRGLAYCWGTLGPTTTTLPTVARSAATQLPLRFARLVAGEDHVCGAGATGDGAWFCWGANDQGQLTNAMPGLDQASPTPMLLGGLRPADVGVARGTSCLVAPNNSPSNSRFEDRNWAYCWGASAAGGGRAYPSPGAGRRGPAVACGDAYQTRCDGFVAVAAANAHACGIHVGRGPQLDGTTPVRMVAQEVVYCWGDNALGQLGQQQYDFAGAYVVPAPADGSRRLGPVQLLDGASCVQDGGKAMCWGGDPADTVPTPVLADLAPGTLAAVRGTPAVCGLRAGDRSAACASAVRRSAPGTPFPVRALEALAGRGAWAAVAAGGQVATFGWAAHGCGVTPTDGAVWCWGNNRFGQLGRGTRSDDDGDFLTYPAARVREPDARPAGAAAALARSPGRP